MSEVCLVTGASSGIGKDISEKLISNGYVVKDKELFYWILSSYFKNKW